MIRDKRNIFIEFEEHICVTYFIQAVVVPIFRGEGWFFGLCYMIILIIESRRGSLLAGIHTPDFIRCDHIMTPPEFAHDRFAGL